MRIYIRTRMDGDSHPNYNINFQPSTIITHQPSAIITHQPSTIITHHPPILVQPVVAAVSGRPLRQRLGVVSIWTVRRPERGPAGHPGSDLGASGQSRGLPGGGAGGHM